MTPTRKRRLIAVALILAAVGIATALTVIALSRNMTYLFSPSEVLAGKAPAGASVQASAASCWKIRYSRDPASLTVDFIVTDRFHDMPVEYTGILPDLFREGQSIIATGKMDEWPFRRARSAGQARRNLYAEGSRRRDRQSQGGQGRKQAAKSASFAPLRRRIERSRLCDRNAHQRKRRYFIARGVARTLDNGSIHACVVSLGISSIARVLKFGSTCQPVLISQQRCTNEKSRQFHYAGNGWWPSPLFRRCRQRTRRCRSRQPVAAPRTRRRSAASDPGRPHGEGAHLH